MPSTTRLSGVSIRGIDFRSHFDALVRVEFQQIFRRNSGLCGTSNVIAIENKMFVLIIFPRMIKQNDFPRIRIERCQVRPFVAIAIWICEREIV